MAEPTYANWAELAADVPDKLPESWRTWFDQLRHIGTQVSRSPGLSAYEIDELRGACKRIMDSLNAAAGLRP